MKLIDAEALKQEILKAPVWTGLDAIAKINTMPSIDIVRCKECRHCLVGVATAQYSNGKQRIENLCEKHKWSVRADDYCSLGERKSDE